METLYKAVRIESSLAVLGNVDKSNLLSISLNWGGCFPIFRETQHIYNAVCTLH